MTYRRYASTLCGCLLHPFPCRPRRGQLLRHLRPQQHLLPVITPCILHQHLPRFHHHHDGNHRHSHRNCGDIRRHPQRAIHHKKGDCRRRCHRPPGAARGGQVTNTLGIDSIGTGKRPAVLPLLAAVSHKPFRLGGQQLQPRLQPVFLNPQSAPRQRHIPRHKALHRSPVPRSDNMGVRAVGKLRHQHHQGVRDGPVLLPLRHPEFHRLGDIHPHAGIRQFRNALR